MSALIDPGFVSLPAARGSLRTVRLRLGLQATQRSIATLLNLLDQGIEADSLERATALERAVGLPGSGEQGMIDERPILVIERDEKAEKELLEGVDLIAQLLERIEIGLRHGLFSGGVPGDPMRHPGTGHCLSGGAE